LNAYCEYLGHFLLCRYPSVIALDLNMSMYMVNVISSGVLQDQRLCLS